MPTHGRSGLEICSSAARPSERCGTRCVRCLSCVNGAMASRKGRLLTKRSLFLSISPVARVKDCVRDPIRGPFGAKLVVLHVVSLPYWYSSELYGVYQPPLPAAEARKGAVRRMQKFLQTIELGGIKVQTAIRMGNPVPEICSFAEKKDVNLIITSTHGLSGLKHVSTGSVAEQVVRHAFCPVLVVPSHPKIRLAKLPKRGRRKTRAMTSPRRQPRK